LILLIILAKFPEIVIIIIMKGLIAKKTLGEGKMQENDRHPAQVGMELA